MLSEQIHSGLVVLEVGRRTRQLSNYLAARNLTHIFGAFMKLPSLRLLTSFAKVKKIRKVKFIKVNLFRPCFQRNSKKSFIHNGLLHHTADSKAAFMKPFPLIQHGVFIIVGLCNTMGRFCADIWQSFLKFLKGEYYFLSLISENHFIQKKRERLG